ncbi:6636_t:CDS:2, partial [Gigaspora rosea]
MLNLNFLDCNRGLIFNEQGIQLSEFKAYDPHQINDFIKNTSFDAKLVNSTTKKESFLLKNHIELSADDLKHANQIFDTDETINSAMTLLADESSTNDIFLVIQCAKVELVINKETIKPSDELISEVKKALNHHDPYHKLMDIFNIYGHFLPKKITLGHKIYRMTYLTVDKDSTEPNDKNYDARWTTLEDFAESKFEDILNQWEKSMSSYSFDSSYLVSINGEFIMKHKISEWIKFCIECDLDSLQVISCKELYPLYEIFDLSLRQEVESVLGISRQIESVLGVNFPVSFKSSNYQVFGKFITQDDEPIDEVIIKFDFMDIFGFLIFIEDYELTYKNSKIAWILIGIPAEVGYFSANTRNINILGSGSESFALKSNNNIVLLKVPENLPQDFIIVVSFKHPPSNYEPNFIAKIQSYHGNEILFHIHCPDYESSDSEENKEDSKTFDDEEMNEELESSNQELIKNASANNDDFKKDDIEFVHKNGFSDKKENIIEEGSNNNYNEVDDTYEEYPKFEDSYIDIDEYDEYSDNNDINEIKMDDFEYENSSYDNRSPETNLIKASKYSIQWFILQNSDITDSSYLNKIGQKFHLKTKS